MLGYKARQTDHFHGYFGMSENVHVKKALAEIRNIEDSAPVWEIRNIEDCSRHFV
jgi:hypothetical protein